MNSNDTFTDFFDLIPLDPSFFQFGLSIQDLYNMDYALPVYGYVTPLLAILVTVTNIMFVAVFIKSGMRSPTHVLLRFMAISDTLTVAIPTPFFVYMFIFENYKEFLSFDVCVVWDYFTSYFPAITHTASIWLTVILAIQRFMCVCFPLNVRAWFGVKRTYASVIVTYIFAIGCYICRFLEKEALPVTLISKLDKTKKIKGCIDRNREWVIDFGSNYMEIYSWARVLLTQLIPCIALALFNGILLCKIKVAENRRKTLRLNNALNQSGSSIQPNSRDSRTTTWLVIIIISSVIVVELPVAIFFALYAYMLTSKETIIPMDMIQPLEIMLNLFVLVSYPLHFVMYSCMSTNFRKTLKQIMTPKCLKRQSFKVNKRSTVHVLSTVSAAVEHDTTQTQDSRL